MMAQAMWRWSAVNSCRVPVTYVAGVMRSTDLQQTTAASVVRD